MIEPRNSVIINKKRERLGLYMVLCIAKAPCRVMFVLGIAGTLHCLVFGRKLKKYKFMGN